MPTPNQERLLDALSENSLIKAALVVDSQGAVKGRRGQSKVLRPENGVAPRASEKVERDNVYMIEMIEDILVVIFDESIEFERLRNAVDVLLRHTGLDKPTED